MRMKGEVLANRSSQSRSKTDFYPTPPDVTIALLDFLEMDGILCPSEHIILEPACGNGKMVDAMLERGYSVKYSDLFPTGYRGDIQAVNFLTAPMDTSVDWIITNPPFSQADQFIHHCLELDKPFAFLLKSQFWHAKSRLELFRKHPPAYVLPLTWRPDFLWGAKSGSPTMEVIWTVWLGDECITEYHPLPKPFVSVNPFSNR